MTKNNLPSNIFRGYDIRAIADTELTNENVELIAKAYATFLCRRDIKDLVVGYDARLSSKRIHEVFVKTMVGCGFKVYDIGLSLTQIVYFAQYHFNTKGGVMITASHNPKEYNGFKLANGLSRTLVGEEIQGLREIAQNEEFEYYSEKGSVIEEDVYPAYEVDLLSKVSVDNKYKIVIDACNGTAGYFLPKFLRKAGQDVVEQNCDLDGNFPSGTPDPTEGHVLERLGERVVEEKADVGFSYDCDGDRLGIVDGNGRVVWNDNLISIFAKDVLEHSPGSSIVYNTLCSKQVPSVIKSAGGNPVMWITGHSYIKAKVKELKSPFGGELSGHFFFMDNFYGHDDGAFASLRLLSHMSKKEKSLARLIDELPIYVSSPEIKFGCPDDRKFDLISNEITMDMKSMFGSEAEYVSIDGIRADTEDKMAIVRASQNGPYITVKFEASTEEGYNELKVDLKDMLGKYSEIDFSDGVNVGALD